MRDLTPKEPSNVTPNYRFVLYDGEDKPNLRDGYNVSMRRMDLALLEMQREIDALKVKIENLEGSK